MRFETRKLLNWYDAHRRALPWRQSTSAAPIDPYRVLVSEAMLQQTQVATVIPYFGRFIEAFPTLQDLSRADEQRVLRLWQGLGYYSRARNLRAAARTIVHDFGGQIPATIDELRTLPGVGRYTAGAIASIAFNRRAAVVDGNVARVLCRLDCIASDPRERQTRERLWRRAEGIVCRSRPGDFNQALMELGATVCTPRNPRCVVCPLQRVCKAFAAGMQNEIPAPRKSQPTPLVRRWTFGILRTRDNRWLIEQRSASGRWAGMWQFVTIEPQARASTAPSAQTIRSAFSIKSTRPAELALVKHGLTHRRYEFTVFRCQTNDARHVGASRQRRWVRLSELWRYPLPRPHLKIARLLEGVDR